MVSFTAMGSLVSYYSKLFDPKFFVWLNAAYYLPGYPCSLLQSSYDDHYDARYGSQKTFRFRLVSGFIIQLLCVALLALPFVPEAKGLILTATVFIGISSWICHGAAVQVSSHSLNLENHDHLCRT